MRQELVEAGGDKMIMAALEEGKTIQEIGEFYADCFWRDETHLNILPAHVFPWASQHIPEMLGNGWDVDGKRIGIPSRREHLLRCE